MTAQDMDLPVKKGFLKAHTRGVGNEYTWVRRFYALFAQSERMQARLDWYNDAKAFFESPSFRRTIYLEQIEKISILLDEEHTFELVNKKNSRSYKFMAETDAEVSVWTNHLIATKNNLQKAVASRLNNGPNRHKEEEEIYAAPNEACTYTVNIAETESSQSCGLSGPYIIVLSQHHISLQDISSRATLYSWPYKLIRRYGCSTCSFTLEAGRKCDSGPGVFTFETTSSKEIFDVVESMTLAMKSSPPTLPERNYCAQKDDPLHENLPQGKHPLQPKRFGQKFLDVFRPKKNDKPDSDSYEMPSGAAPPAPQGEPVYHVYDQTKDLKSKLNMDDMDDALEECAYAVADESGGNSMSEMAAAAILQEVTASGNVEYDSLDLCNIPVAHKTKKTAGHDDKNVYCELPRSEVEEALYADVKQFS